MCPSLAAHILDFKEVLNRRNRLKFPTTTVADLKQYIINLQAKQHAERRQPGFKRLDLFLKRFEDFGELIKSLPGAMEFMGFVWVTACHPDAFSNLLDVYAQVGRSQPSLAMYKELFVIEPELTHILSVAYNDIVIVNKWLVIYFQQRLWPELFSTTWKRQKSRITRVMIRMTSRLDLVNSRANLAQFDFHLHETALQDEQLLATIESENLGRKQAVHAWLKPTDMEKEQDYLERTRSDYPHTCRWLLNDRTFKEWFDPQQTTTTLPKLLWMNGKPGSGKTVLASLVVQEARKLKPASTVLFFYFMQEDTDRHTFFSMARTFLMQILEQNPDTLDYFYSKCCGSGILLSSRALIEDLLKLALANCDSTYIVLDGLDQCVSRKERGEVVRWFRDVTEDLPPHMRHRFHCLFISQNDSARKDYRDLASITVDADKNEDDIEEFSKIQSKRLVAKLGISEKEASEIAVSVSASAEGMFLFAHLVWINLCGQSSIHALEEEMKSFPTDLDRLDKIYAQRMQAIMNKPVRAQREEALMLLGRLVCAKRSLKLHEVQTMISIDLDRRVVDFDRRHLRVHLVELCESLVDVREDGTIEWVHMTAKSAYLDVVAEELRLATLCINYLCLPSFRVPSSEESVLAGEYGLMEYAMIYWLRHLEAGLVSSISGYDDLRSDLAEALEILVEQHWNNPTADIRSISNHTRDMLETFRGCQSYLRIQTAVVLTDKELKHFGDTRPEQSALDFAGIVAAVRRSLEAVVQNNADPVTANNLELKYGIHLFRCPRFSCKHFTEGFSTPDERESHIERHQRPARCTDEHCRGSRIGFETQAQLERHLKEYHPDTTDRCHNFPTEEEINESLRETLPESEPEAEHEPEGLYDNGMAQLLAEADPAVDPAREEAAPLSTRPKDTSKRRKMKQSYECAHCGKEFNKKFNWQSHLASHGGDQRHICPNCGKACARSGDLARHMKLHNPDNAVTCGGILSNGQQWGCGRSFARVDILRSHHKSKQGRRCIAARDTGEQAGP
ncbi:hypothetical protein CC86DRAFT_290274 [Ophiobolus disseminans]|uniref:C2H2 domain-containing protein n=1 Tax=Ophiobolus disseminans TaxID=1469910 RepID=A0A6A7A2A5_9PLEO|nr:hypothetical protein CC86DRAFT_290274 [Ophiobolus disseminans]